MLNNCIAIPYPLVLEKGSDFRVLVEREIWNNEKSSRVSFFYQNILHFGSTLGTIQYKNATFKHTLMQLETWVSKCSVCSVGRFVEFFPLLPLEIWERETNELCIYVAPPNPLPLSHSHLFMIGIPMWWCSWYMNIHT